MKDGITIDILELKDVFYENADLQDYIVMENDARKHLLDLGVEDGDEVDAYLDLLSAAIIKVEMEMEEFMRKCLEEEIEESDEITLELDQGFLRYIPSTPAQKEAGHARKRAILESDIDARIADAQITRETYNPYLTQREERKVLDLSESLDQDAFKKLSDEI